MEVCVLNDEWGVLRIPRSCRLRGHNLSTLHFVISNDGFSCSFFSIRSNTLERAPSFTDGQTDGQFIVKNCNYYNKPVTEILSVNKNLLKTKPPLSPVTFAPPPPWR
ncbi:hypothetical protein SFRURICE_010630 [Spodoptera frugiperda]|nr:hypothetical protein SFRURICE_010630 [Spodoptera frugiperda]